MKRYGLFFKNSNETINNIPSVSLEEAKMFFMTQKRLPLNKFDELFIVKQIN
jgi:hypothetical protein